MRKQTVYYVQNDRTNEFLGRNGAWTRRRPSLIVLRFESEAEAQAAIPPGVACSIVKGTVPVEESEP
jgi:hypothetical protein